jgi:hypothetical protein
MRFIIAILIFIIPMQSAKADWPYNLLEFKCLNEYNYVLIRTFMLYNIDIDNEKKAKKLADKHDMYTLSYLNKLKSLTCKLPSGTVKLTVEHYHGSFARGECGGVEWADITISVNDRILINTINTHSHCGGHYKTIRIDGNGAEVCQVKEYDSPIDSGRMALLHNSQAVDNKNEFLWHFYNNFRLSQGQLKTYATTPGRIDYDTNGCKYYTYKS